MPYLGSDKVLSHFWGSCGYEEEFKPGLGEWEGGRVRKGHPGLVGNMDEGNRARKLSSRCEESVIAATLRRSSVPS